MQFKSYAKLNLYLKVLNKRRDKFHNIITIFERIDLADKITLTSRPDVKINLKCNLPDLPSDANNLAYRSAKLLQESLRVKKGVDINLIKNIPVSAGLGGGSSNAASVIMGLNRLWGLKLSQEKMVKFAKKIGSDVPFFIYDCSFAYGTGRGDKIRPLNALKNIRLWHILVVPRIKVSTPLIYQKWDELMLTIPKDNVKIIERQGQTLIENVLSRRSDRIVGSRDSVPQQGTADFSPGGASFNSLEAVTEKLYPQVSRVKEALANLGVKSILMSGSGPAVLGIVSSKKEDVSLCEQLGKINRGWRVFVTRTY